MTTADFADVLVQPKTYFAALGTARRLHKLGALAGMYRADRLHEDHWVVYVPVTSEAPRVEGAKFRCRLEQIKPL
jgi:hypothetical protein